MCPASMAPFLVLGDVREGDVAEIDHAVGRDGHAFGEDHAAVEDFFQLAHWGDNIRFTLRTPLMSGEQNQDGDHRHSIHWCCSFKKHS